MKILVYLLAIVWTYSCFVDGDELPSGKRRLPRRLMNYVKKPASSSYKSGTELCEVRGLQGACLNGGRCEAAGGRFAGFCGGDKVCCLVEASCDGSTYAQTALFRNPSFPRNDTDPRMCPFKLNVNRGICAVRVDFKVLELAPYEDGLCIRDTLTILSSSGRIATPVCGNMTNYATTFEVKELSEVTLAMVVQGLPAYRFSIQVTQLPCSQILEFQSPTYAGIKNEDGEVYTPTTTTTTTTTTETPTTIAAEVSDEDSDEDTSTFLPPVRHNSGSTTTRPTTLRTGNIRIVEKPEVIVRSALKPEDEEEEGIYTETVSKVSPISSFSKAYTSLFDSSSQCGFDRRPDVEEQIRQDNRPVQRVIGGEYTQINEYPWQVALVYKKKFFCGGSLISDRHILTAAHCIFGSFSGGLDHLRVSLGDMDLTTKNETKNIVARVKRVFFHLNYSPHTTANDIGLFELETPVNFTYAISAVKLPTDLNDDYDDVDATVTGWGRYSVTKKATSSVMKEYTGPLTPIDECVKNWSKFPGIDAEKKMHICLAVQYGTPCHGDSGGPLVSCNGPQCTQIGVVSFGFPLCTNVGLPAVFTRVTSYKRWIDISLSPLLYHSNK